ncbi:MAG: hypothetical protein M1826_002797 [Phylliscum demangeonii]|nr:MAG: hypothetical protein M1826_002797 [Phylliscum demangeonii]
MSSSVTELSPLSKLRSSPKNWFCVIFANPDAIDRVSKAWVPKSYDGEELWFKADKIDSYIKKLESSWDPAKTLRMSIIEGTEHDDLQMLIPPGLLNSNGGGMGITASCKEKIDDIPDQRVNYKDWHNIKGDEQPAFASPVCSFHLTQWDYAEFKDTDGDERYEVEVKLFDDNKTQIGFQPRTKAGNAHPLSMTSKLPTLIVTPEAKNDYIQFNYANEAWPSNGKFGANDCK